MKFTSSLTSRIPVADGSLSIIVPQLVAPGQLGQKGMESIVVGASIGIAGGIQVSTVNLRGSRLDALSRGLLVWVLQYF